jgi:hypothetical protein
MLRLVMMARKIRGLFVNLGMGDSFATRGL